VLRLQQDADKPPRGDAGPNHRRFLGRRIAQFAIQRVELGECPLIVRLTSQNGNERLQFRFRIFRRR
jgi:hypothetical protein